VTNKGRLLAGRGPDRQTWQAVAASRLRPGAAVLFSERPHPVLRRTDRTGGASRTPLPLSVQFRPGDHGNARPAGHIGDPVVTGWHAAGAAGRGAGVRNRNRRTRWIHQTKPAWKVSKMGHLVFKLTGAVPMSGTHGFLD